MREELKSYEIDGVHLRFMPDGNPMEGLLSVQFPEHEPYAAHLSLAKTRARKEYANAAAEHTEINEDLLKKVLVDLCSTRFEEIEAAREAAQGPAEDPEGYPEVGEEEVEALVGRPGVLARFVGDATEIHGVVGEEDPLKLLTLNALGAQLAPLPNGKPIGANVVLIARWGRGKNHLCDAVATLLPDTFYLAFESASAMSLYYRAEKDPRVLAHRWIYLNEAEAMDQLVEMLRPLISGGKAVHLTVNKGGDGRNVAQELMVEGPITTTIPTIRNKLDAQLQSRMLTAELKDYKGRVAKHSRKVSELLLPGFASEDFSPRIRAWKAALYSLAAVRRVVFPLDCEEFCFDRDDVSYGARLWGNLLGLMCDHAWLEQRNRKITTLDNGESVIVATPEDYEVAYDVFEKTCERSIEPISDTHRKILDALYELREGEMSWGGFTQKAISEKSGIPRSTISDNRSFLVMSLRWVWEPEGGGLALVNDADPSWWKKGDVLVGLPRPEQVREWWSNDE